MVAGLPIGGVQLVDIVVKLKHTFDGIENLPRGISDLVQEVEVIATQLSTVETELARDAIFPEIACSENAAHFNMVKCAEYCRQALSALSDLTVAFEAKLSGKKGLGRGIVMAKLFLRKDQLEKLQNKLDRTVKLLKWAQNCYVQAQLSHLMEMSRSQHQVVVSAITTLQTSHDSTAALSHTTSTKTSDNHGESELASSSSHPASLKTSKVIRSKPVAVGPGKLGTFRFRNWVSGYSVLIQLPTWLPRIAWELQAHRESFTSTYRFRQYRYRNYNEPVFRYAAEGSVDMLRRLFAKGGVSPFDREELNGSTLLHIALKCSQIETSNFLTNLGLGVDEVDFRGESPLPWFYDETSVKSEDLQSRRVLDILGSEPTFRRAVWILGTTPNTDQPLHFQKLRDWLFPEYEEISLVSRLLIARSMAGKSIWQGNLAGKTLRLTLSLTGDITPEMVAVSDSENLSVLHTFAVAFAAVSHWCNKGDDDVSDIQLSLGDLATISGDLHHCERVSFLIVWNFFERSWRDKEWEEANSQYSWPPGTALLTIMRVSALRGVYSDLFIYRRRVWVEKLNRLIRRWISILAGRGVDLEAYGERERALIIGNAQNEPDARRLIPRLEEIQPFPGIMPGHYFEWDSVPCQLSVRDFRYGPRIEDWSVEWHLELLVDVKAFWDLVEDEDEEDEAPVFGPLRMPGGWVEECSDEET